MIPPACGKVYNMGNHIDVRISGTIIREGGCSGNEENKAWLGRADYNLYLDRMRDESG